ncbi:unnamed protein product [Parnassius apollo]|uniref:(apollo) hypothetical protein n=1 Tax=Parnassius apollo TaxID=110799 RepID=A0A8S3WIP7_PARAO|nr:unnamed protein product [Parnassius apollo]
MPKCDNCDKLIAKKSTILECNTCSKTVHATQACTRLTSKQLAALRNTENLEWTCEICRRETPRQRSFVIQEEEEEDDEELLLTQGTDSGSNAMKKVTKRHIIRELKIDAMEQYIGNLEQKQLNNTFEVAGVPEIKDENTEIILNTLATKLNIVKKEITTVKRLKGKNGKEGVIQVSFKQEEQVDQWIKAARKVTILAEDIVSCPDPATARTKIMIRRALSSANKTLLWQAKQKLKPLINTDCDAICVTLDLWTLRKTESYIAVTGHFISRDFQLKTILLDYCNFSGHHTSVNIAAELRRILDDWDLTRKVNFAVSDNASNVTNAVKNHLGWKHYGCYAHTLNLVLQDSLDYLKDNLGKIKKKC